jgi:hypothetical protein
MNTPIEKPKRISRRKGRSDMKVGFTKQHRDKPSITREQFHALVRKSAQPIKKASESDLASDETSESRLSDDYSGKNTH